MGLRTPNPPRLSLPTSRGSGLKKHFFLVIEIFSEDILAIPLSQGGADRPGRGGQRPPWAFSAIALRRPAR